MRRKEPKPNINEQIVMFISAFDQPIDNIIIGIVNNPTNPIITIRLSINLKGPRSHKSKRTSASLLICDFDIIFPSRA